jgi:hypothetical protein
VLLTVDDLVSWQMCTGITSHRDIVTASQRPEMANDFTPGNHTDPGASFPWPSFLARVLALLGPQEAPMPFALVRTDSTGSSPIWLWYGQGRRKVTEHAPAGQGATAVGSLWLALGSPQPPEGATVEQFDSGLVIAGTKVIVPLWRVAENMLDAVLGVVDHEALTSADLDAQAATIARTVIANAPPNHGLDASAVALAVRDLLHTNPLS